MADMLTRREAIAVLQDMMDRYGVLLKQVEAMSHQNHYICLECGTTRNVNYNDRLKICYCDARDDF